MSVYNNNSNGTVTHARVLTSSDNPTDSTHMIKIVTNGAAKPGTGGFINKTTSYANAVFYHVFVAKVPVGYKVNNHANHTGDGRTFTWLTSQEGTGEWELYAYRLNAGSTGSFRDFGHVALTANPGYSSTSVTWYLAAATMYDATGVAVNSNVSGPSAFAPTMSSTVTYTYKEGDGKLLAIWLANNYTLTLDSNGGTITTNNNWIGSGSSATKQVTYDYTIGVLPTSSEINRTGYGFTGWKIGGTTITDSYLWKYRIRQRWPNGHPMILALKWLNFIRRNIWG